MVTVFSPDGTNLLYSTYLGGSHADIPHSLAYNETWGNIVLFGTTGSSNFPTTPGVVQPDLAPGPATDVDIYGVDTQPDGVDCYLASFNGVDFTLEAATYFGGSGNDGQNKAAGLNANFGDEYRGQIDIGPDGSIWIATTTTSQDLNLPGSPAPAGSYDALVAGFRTHRPSFVAAPSGAAPRMQRTAWRSPPTTVLVHLAPCRSSWGAGHFPQTCPCPVAPFSQTPSAV